MPTPGSRSSLRIDFCRIVFSQATNFHALLDQGLDRLGVVGAGLLDQADARPVADDLDLRVRGLLEQVRDVLQARPLGARARGR